MRLAAVLEPLLDAPVAEIGPDDALDRRAGAFLRVHEIGLAHERALHLDRRGGIPPFDVERPRELVKQGLGEVFDPVPDS